MRLAVGYPWSSPFMFTGFTEHLPNLVHPPDCDVRFFRGQGWCPARRHAHICEQALEWEADLICIIGSDQIHPEDMLVRLVQRFHDGHEVVTALVPARGYVSWQDMKPFQPMGWRFKTNPQEFVGGRMGVCRQWRGAVIDKDMIEPIPNDGDIHLVNFIGSGVLLFHRDHLLALEKPWFAERFHRETMQRVACMDCVFIWRLQSEAHAKVWCDTSIKVRHCHVFEIDDTFQERFADWQEGGGDPAICRYDTPKEAVNA